MSAELEQRVQILEAQLGAILEPFGQGLGRDMVSPIMLGLLIKSLMDKGMLSAEDFERIKRETISLLSESNPEQQALKDGANSFIRTVSAATTIDM